MEASVKLLEKRGISRELSCQATLKVMCCTPASTVAQWAASSESSANSKQMPALFTLARFAAMGERYD
jgi:hypothetical protein